MSSQKQLYAIVDIETTGSGGGDDKITEIAIVLHDGSKIIDKYETLLNPGKYIPAFITNLTGITNNMVADAPPFEEVSDIIWEMTENAIFIAHNVGFDYGFLQKEFAAIGRRFIRKKLCTVRLCRKVFPGFHSYGLGKLITRFGISVNDRHRAMADTLATVIVFEKILQNDTTNQVQLQLNNGLLVSDLPPNISMDSLHELPERIGVFYFHDADGRVLYVGKGRNIQRKVMSQLARSSKRMIQLKKEMTDITFELSGNDLIMLIQEGLEIDKHRPKYNIAKRKSNFAFCIHEYQNEGGFQCLAVGQYSKYLNVIAGFELQIEADEVLKKFAKEHGLCNQYLHMNTKELFARVCQHPSCNNTSCSTLDSEEYNKKVSLAIETIRVPFEEEFALIGKGRTKEEKSVLLVQEGEFKGFGFFDYQNISHFEEILLAVKNQPHLSIFEYYIKKTIRKGNAEKIIPLAASNF